MNEEIKEIREILRNCEKALNDASGYNNTTDRILDYITNLQEENERLKKVYIKPTFTKREIEKYKSRIDKAIDYIKETNEIILSNGYIENLLNILQGSDKE